VDENKGLMLYQMGKLYASMSEDKRQAMAGDLVMIQIDVATS
jgi:hypothetical protein